MLMMRPERRSFIDGSTAFASNSGLFTKNSS